MIKFWSCMVSICCMFEHCPLPIFSYPSLKPNRLQIIHFIKHNGEAIDHFDPKNLMTFMLLNAGYAVKGNTDMMVNL